MPHISPDIRSQSSPPRLNLLFDADDTLWQNNVYFERAIAAFISFVDHRTHTEAEVREHLNACERETIAQHGYGLQSFRRSLARCFEQIVEVPVTPETHASLVAFTNLIADAEIELLPRVAETLATLGERHRLLLVTKGNWDEQTGKLERSGLGPLFSAVEVLPEKTADRYRELAERHNCQPAETWMIGNSPRSDINPALAVGWNAVYIPHDSTWVLEHEAIEHPSDPARLLELKSFAELTTRF